MVWLSMATANSFAPVAVSPAAAVFLSDRHSAISVNEIVPEFPAG